MTGELNPGAVFEDGCCRVCGAPVVWTVAHDAVMGAVDPDYVRQCIQKMPVIRFEFVCCGVMYTARLCGIQFVVEAVAYEDEPEYDDDEVRGLA